MSAGVLRVRGGAGALRGRVRAPGDKSLTHRALLLAAMAHGESRIRGANAGDDCCRLLAALRALGVAVRGEPPGEIAIDGRGVEAWRAPEGPLDLGNSGTALRLLAGALAVRSLDVTLTGDASLRARPMLRVVEPLRRMGARIDGADGGRHAPLVVSGPAPGARLRAIRYVAPIPSAQVKSAILLAGLGADGVTSIAEAVVSRDHTERLLKSMGAQLAFCDGNARLTPGRPLSPLDWDLPRDTSGAAFLLAAACLVPGSEVVAEGVSLNPTRTGFLDVMRRMGAEIACAETGAAYREPVGDVTARAAPLRGTAVAPREVPALVDEVPILAAVAACAEGETRFDGVGELRMKESDRLDAIVSGLRTLGAEAEAGAETLVVRGGAAARLRGARVESRGDHRIAMAFAVLGLVASGETAIDGAEMIETSFPGFYGALRALQAGGARAEGAAPAGDAA